MPGHRSPHGGTESSPPARRRRPAANAEAALLVAGSSPPPADGSAGPLLPVERPASLRQIVYDTLTRLIISGSLRPGQHLAEAELAKHLGVSRQPVREALHRLQAEGWVDLRPALGAFVHQPTDQEVDQLLSVRSLLETEAARLAAKAAKLEHIQLLHALLSDGNDALERSDVQRLVTANSALHAAVTTASGNTVLAQMVALIDRRMRWYYTPIAGARSVESWHEHAELVDALATGEARRAAEVMRRHIERTRRAYHAYRAGGG